MPTGLGLHPYFPLTEATRLRFAAINSYTLDMHGFPEHAPSGHVEVRLAAAGLLSPTIGNRYFDGVQTRLLINDDHRRHDLLLQWSSRCTNLALHVEPENALFCVEPMTHAVGALSHAELVETSNGMAVLATGESQVISLSIAAVEADGRRRNGGHVQD